MSGRGLPTWEVNRVELQVVVGDAAADRRRPAVVAGLFSYGIAVSKAEGTTEERTNVTYDTLSEAVDGLKANVTTNRQDLEELQKFLDELRAEIAKVSRGGTPSPDLPTFTLSNRTTRRALPHNLDAAILLQKQVPRPTP